MGRKIIVGKVRPKKGVDYFTEDDILALREYFAPAGYGVGEDTQQLILKEDLDNTFASGLYWVECPGTAVNDQSFDHAILRVSGMGSIHCVQELYPQGHSMKLTRLCNDGIWQDGWGLYTWESEVIL